MNTTANINYITDSRNVIGSSHHPSLSEGTSSIQREDSSVSAASYDSYHQCNYEILAIKRVLAEGWSNKKGSGQDIRNSTEWKVRWAKLAVRPLTFVLDAFI